MKVEIRKNCRICGKENPKRFRTFCSTKCRTRSNTVKGREYRREWQIKRNDKVALIPSKDKVQCLVCGKWYVQVGSHIVQRHGLTAREYREEFELPIKRGIVPRWYRDLKGSQAKENGTYQNLESGKEFWFKKGDDRAKVKSGWKGRVSKEDKAKLREIYSDSLRS